MHDVNVRNIDLKIYNFEFIYFFYIQVNSTLLPKDGQVSTGQMDTPEISHNLLSVTVSPEMSHMITLLRNFLLQR